MVHEFNGGPEFSSVQAQNSCGRDLARAVGAPFVPITPTFPWLGPLGLIPLPTRWKIRFGKPMDLAPYDEKAADEKKPETAKPEEKAEDEKKDEAKPAPEGAKPKPQDVKVKIDFENVSQRILALPMPPRRYVSLQAGKPGVLYAVEEPPFAPGTEEIIDAGVEQGPAMGANDFAQLVLNDAAGGETGARVR